MSGSRPIRPDLHLCDLAGRRVAVWGLGAEGIAAARLLARRARLADLVFVVDATPASPPADLADVPVLSAADWDGGADVIVKSPGVSPYHGRFAEIVRAQSIGVTGGTALWFAENAGVRTIAVTGSKGKSTTSSLVAHLSNALGRPTVLAGNVGRALLDVLAQELDSPTAAHWYAVETSSYQASEVLHSPEVGVLTALFPEHLDWHETEERYFADKVNLFAHRDEIAVAVNGVNPRSAALLPTLRGAHAFGVADGLHVRVTSIVRPDGTLVVDTAGSQLLGEHNLVNLAGALSAIELSGLDLTGRAEELGAAVRAFRPLAHRLEPVGTVDGRFVVDDSLSTAPEAAVAALAAFADRPVGIIVGGHDRGLDYGVLADAVSARRQPLWVAAVPESGPRIVALLESALAARQGSGGRIQLHCFDDFDEAVAHLGAVVPAGGVIALSPGAPSFGRFTDYAERGRHFRSLLGLA